MLGRGVSVRTVGWLGAALRRVLRRALQLDPVDPFVLAPGEVCLYSALASHAGVADRVFVSAATLGAGIASVHVDPAAGRPVIAGERFAVRVRSLSNVQVRVHVGVYVEMECGRLAAMLLAPERSE